jgi:hypothetical protein
VHSETFEMRSRRCRNKPALFVVFTPTQPAFPAAAGMNDSPAMEPDINVADIGIIWLLKPAIKPIIMRDGPVRLPFHASPPKKPVWPVTTG